MVHLVVILVTSLILTLIVVLFNLSLNKPQGNGKLRLNVSDSGVVRTDQSLIVSIHRSET